MTPSASSSEGDAAAAAAAPSTPVKRHACAFEGCGKSFKRRTDLELHSYTHSTERPFQCSECAKAFKHPSNLNVHRLTHAKEEKDRRPYACHYDGCDRRFTHHNSLKEHIGSHRNRGEQPLFKCPGCAKAYSHRKSLYRHKLKAGHHEERAAQSTKEVPA
ncbi:hypothetical protein PINS_up007800 [Pythium insidiosum]|nr:hypothetical protein PINS_up007800 [Pythium insidiosum]